MTTPATCPIPAAIHYLGLTCSACRYSACPCAALWSSVPTRADAAASSLRHADVSVPLSKISSTTTPHVSFHSGRLTCLELADPHPPTRRQSTPPCPATVKASRNVTLKCFLVSSLAVPPHLTAPTRTDTINIPAVFYART